MNELQKLIDHGWEVRFYPNALGSITAVAKNHSVRRKEITDDFTLAALMQRISDKCFQVGEYA